MIGLSTVGCNCFPLCSKTPSTLASRQQQWRGVCNARAHSAPCTGAQTIERETVPCLTSREHQLQNQGLTQVPCPHLNLESSSGDAQNPLCPSASRGTRAPVSFQAPTPIDMSAHPVTSITRLRTAPRLQRTPNKRGASGHSPTENKALVSIGGTTGAAATLAYRVGWLGLIRCD